MVPLSEEAFLLPDISLDSGGQGHSVEDIN